MSGGVVYEATPEWLQGRLDQLREELAAARDGRPVWLIETEIEELEYLLASDGAA